MRYFSRFFLRNFLIKPLKIPFFFCVFLNKNHFFSLKSHENLQKLDDFNFEELISKISEEFLKTLVIDGLFHANTMINEGSIFVEMLSQQEILQKAVTILILNNIKTENFQEKGRIFTKEIIEGITDKNEGIIDKTEKNITILEKDLNYLFLRTLRDPETKLEVLSVFTWILSQKEAKETLITLFEKVVQDENVKKAITNALKAAIFEILMNKMTVEKMKSFSLNLIELESKDEEGAIKRFLRGFQQKNNNQKVQRKNGDSPEEKEEIREFFSFSF